MAQAATKASSNAPNFGSILDKPATDFNRPPPLPGGHYLCVCMGLPRKDKSTKKQTDYIEHVIKFLKPFENSDGETDVDTDELRAVGGIGDETTMKLTFYITEKAGYRYREFLEEDLGVDLEDKSLWEGAQETAGKQLVVFVKQTPRDDGKGMFSEISRTMPVPE